MLKRGLVAVLILPVGLALAAARWAPGGAPAVSPVPALRAAPRIAPLRLVVTHGGNEARYRIRERLVGMELPYDAVGRTSGISGAIELDDAGRLVPQRSRIVVDVTSLTSDKERRDGYVQRRLLETERHPTVELAPTAIRGLTGPLPASGVRSFELLGNLTVRGVTRPTRWRVTARFQNGIVTGTAATAFTFADFELTKPSVPVVLTLADTLELEYDFTLDRRGSPGR